MILYLAYLKRKLGQRSTKSGIPEGNSQGTLNGYNTTTHANRTHPKILGKPNTRPNLLQDKKYNHTIIVNTYIKYISISSLPQTKMGMKSYKKWDS